MMRLTPILNVSDLVESFRWFEKLGWEKGHAVGRPRDARRHPDGHVFRISRGTAE